jgi:hypothetical protein
MDVRSALGIIRSPSPLRSNHSYLLALRGLGKLHATLRHSVKKGRYPSEELYILRIKRYSC